MHFFVKTDIDKNSVNYAFKYYLRSCACFYWNNKTINDYLIKNYKLSLIQTLKAFVKDCNISQIDKNMYEIYVNDNIFINSIKLNSLVSLLEYGNLDIKAPKIISSLINNTIIRMRNSFGGN